MRNAITTLLEVVGLVAVSVGAGLAYIPAGVMAAGVSCVVVGVLEGRK